MPSESHNTPPNEPQARGHQAEGLAVRTIVSFGIGLLGLVIVVQAGLALAMRYVIPQRPLVHVNEQWRQQQLGPGVRPNQAYDRHHYDQKQEQRLQSYGWQDEAHHAARIPIDRAIELMSQRKLQVEWPSSSQEKPTEADPPPKQSTKEDAP